MCYICNRSNIQRHVKCDLSVIVIYILHALMSLMTRTFLQRLLHFTYASHPARFARATSCNLSTPRLDNVAHAFASATRLIKFFHLSSCVPLPSSIWHGMSTAVDRHFLSCVAKACARASWLVNGMWDEQITQMTLTPFSKRFAHTGGSSDNSRRSGGTFPQCLCVLFMWLKLRATDAYVSHARYVWALYGPVKKSS